MPQREIFCCTYLIFVGSRRRRCHSVLELHEIHQIHALHGTKFVNGAFGLKKPGPWAAHAGRKPGKIDQIQDPVAIGIAGGQGRRKSLEACLASPETERKLQQDIASAARFGIDGTPLVLVNGRRGTSFGPFLYAMILTGGDASDPAFASLPPPNPNAHLH